MAYTPDSSQLNSSTLNVWGLPLMSWLAYLFSLSNMLKMGCDLERGVNEPMCHESGKEVCHVKNMVDSFL